MTADSDPLQRLVLADRVEAAAYEDMFAAAPGPLAQGLGLQTHRVADATVLVAARVPDPMFNRVIGLGLESEPTDADLDRIDALYRTAGVARYWMHRHETPAGAALARRLARRGFVPPARRAWAKMVRPRSVLPPVQTALPIRAATADESGPLAAAIAASFGMPPPMVPWLQALAHRAGWRAFVAHTADAAAPVGGGFLYVDPASGAGWLGAGGVRADWRGRSAHRALMVARLQAAYDAGCSVVVTETGEAVSDEPNPSLRNMRWCGFEQVSRRLNLVAPD